MNVAEQSRAARFPWIVARILFGLGLASGGPVLGQEFAPQQFGLLCALDMAEHCENVRPGGGRFVQCLQEHRDKLSEACREAVTPSDYDDRNEGLSITVSIERIRSEKGAIVVGLHDNPLQFPGARRTFIGPVGPSSFVATFKHLKPGSYVVSAFHDENENGSLDEGEGRGYSNGQSAPRDFVTSAVKVNSDANLTISVSYP